MPTDRIDATIRTMLAAGHNFAEIGRATGLSRSTIRRRRQRMSIAQTTRGGIPKAKANAAELATIREQIAVGASITSISRLLGYSRPTITKFIREHDLHAPSTPEFLAKLFRQGYRSREIVIRTGLPLAEVLKRRAQWTAQRQHETAKERAAAKEADRIARDAPADERADDKLSIALFRWRKQPLHSLTVNERPRDYPGTVIGWAA